MDNFEKQHEWVIIHKERKNKKFGGSLADYKLVEELGRGAFGTVFKCQSFLIPNQFFVLKKIPLTVMKNRNTRVLLKEVSLLWKLNHPHIIRYYHSFIDKEAFYILMEYAEGGDIHSVSTLTIVCSKLQEVQDTPPRERDLASSLWNCPWPWVPPFPEHRPLRSQKYEYSPVQGSFS